MIEMPIFVYAAVPISRTKFVDLFSDGPTKRLLENPGGLRQSGWDLQTLDTARIVEGEYLEVRNGDRKVLNLYESGVFLVRAAATDDLLAWGSSESQPDTLRLNSLAVIEFTYNFVDLYRQFVDLLSPQPALVTFRLQIENAKGDRILYMFPYGVNAIHWQHPLDHDRHPAPSNRQVWELPIAAGELKMNPARVACQLVEPIYFWFGLKIEEIPYIKAENGTRMIDVDVIARGGK